MSVADLPPPDSFAHGTRARYVAARCRCDACRAANAAYARGRAVAKARGEWNGLVDATPAREHLKRLRRAGVGKRSVAAACDVALSIIWEVGRGERARIRKGTLNRILSVTSGALGDHALVRAGRTWQRIRAMQKVGLSVPEIARRMGFKTAHIQIGRRRVLARTALSVERLHRAVMREAAEEAAIERRAQMICLDCGTSHEKEDRLASLRRVLPASLDELREAHPCWWGGATNGPGERRLFRDLKSAGARKVGGEWAVG